MTATSLSDAAVLMFSLGLGLRQRKSKIFRTQDLMHVKHAL